MTNLQDEAYQAIARSKTEYGQIIEPYLEKEIQKEIATWTDNECIKFLQKLMTSNAQRGTLRQWWERNRGSGTDPIEIAISLKDYFDLK
jgi:hypothetical protein